MPADRPPSTPISHASPGPAGRGRARQPVTTLAVLAVAALALVACSAAPSDEAVPATGSVPITDSVPPAVEVADRSPGCDRVDSAPWATSEQVEVDLTSGDSDRRYQRYVPASYDDGSAAPLVVDLHGYLSGADAQIAISDFAALAEREGFVVATPQGNSDMPYWNATPEASLPDDVAFVSDVIADVGTDLCIDPARVYVDGFSNGAFLASLIACRLADQVAAVATVSGLLVPEDCDPSRPVPIVAFHGTDDQFVSFAGAPNPALETLTWNADSTLAFERLPFQEVTAALATWATSDGCAPAPTNEQTSAEVKLITYTGCEQGSTVQLYVIDGGGHAWPGSQFSKASEAILGHTTFDIDATEVIWAFFAQHPMR